MRIYQKGPKRCSTSNISTEIAVLVLLLNARGQGVDSKISPYKKMFPPAKACRWDYTMREKSSIASDLVSSDLVASDLVCF